MSLRLTLVALVAFIAGIGITTVCPAFAQQVSEEASESIAEPQPTVRIAPAYPTRALTRGMEGYVDLSFIVTTAGTVRDPVVLYSTNSVFERAAIRSVLKWKYDSQPAEASVTARVEFNLED